MPIELKDRLLRSQEKCEELECFIGQHFQRGKHIEKSVIEYGELLRVHYCKKGISIKSITWPDDASSDQMNELIKSVDEALYSQLNKKIAHKVIFFDQPVTGHLRIGDEFQIIPLPPEYPQPPELCADHPAILEYSYEGSDILSLDHLRQQKRLQDLSHFLGAIHQHLNYFGKDTSNRFWTITPSNNKFQSSWVQEGYYYHDCFPDKDQLGFSVSTDWKPIILEEPNKYYKKWAATVGEDTRFPEFTEACYYKFESISPENKTTFLRAIHWFLMSEECRQQSQSLAYSVLVFAIETLILPAQKIMKCDTCGTEKFESIGKRFKKFMMQYSQNLSNKQIDQFLKMRSKFIHGDTLMMVDSGSSIFRFNPVTNIQGNQYIELKLICRTVLLNWFLTNR